MRGLQLLLLWVALLLPAAHPRAVAAAAAAAADSRFSIYSNPPFSSAAVQQQVRRPVWLPGPVASTSDGPSGRSKQLFPGARPSQQQQQQLGTQARAASLPPRPNRFIVQLQTPSAAAALAAPSVLLPEDLTSVAAGLPSPQQASTTAAEQEDHPRSIRPGRITPQAAAAAQAVQTQAASVAAAAGLTRQVTHTYSYALAGFAVQSPTAGQLAALAADPKVLSVTADRMLYAMTYSTPQFLGLRGSSSRGSPRGSSSSSSGAGAARRSHKPDTRSSGVWDELGGVEGSSGAGEDVIIGVIDTGIHMDDHSCFADSNYWGAGNTWKQDYKQLLNWKGICSASEQQACNNKVVGCRYFTAGWGGDEAMSLIYPDEPLSCKDEDGHGSHTASTAAGNYGDSSTQAPSGAVLSGMAPRARLAIYKALWGGYGQASDLVAAIEAAIVDGVDVLSYSLGGGTNADFRRPEMMAFMNAGNGFDVVSTEAIVPWVTTVAASTHDRILEVVLSLGNGQQLAGRGPNVSPLGPLPLVYAADIAATDNRTKAGLCAPDSLNATALSLRGPAIVACDRGGGLTIKVKGDEVLRVGAAGWVLMNIPGGLTNLWPTLDSNLPHVHVTSAHREVVLAYTSSSSSGAAGAGAAGAGAAGAGAGGTAATATIQAATVKLGQTAPVMADFSSRGPIPVANAVVLKPDITAPGVDIFAAYGSKHAYLNGTSMSTPAIAGIAALLKGRYPKWSAMAIKSAIMTTAYQTTRTGTTGQQFGTPLLHGAGHVDPEKALKPGLVFDSSFKDWQRFLCDVDPFPGDDCAKLCPSPSTTSPGGGGGSSSQPPPASTPPRWRVPSAGAPPVKAADQLDGLQAQQQLLLQPQPPLPGAAAAGITSEQQQQPGPATVLIPAVPLSTQADGSSTVSEQQQQQQQQEEEEPVVGAQNNKPRRPGKPKPPPTDDGSGSGSGIPDRPCDAYNFNGPYISGAATGSLTVTRILTSVVPSKEGRLSFTATGAPDPGSQFDVVVAPAAVGLRGGESQKVTITVKPRAGAPPNEYQFGEVVWRSSKGHVVRIPIAVTFSDFFAPAILTPALRLPEFQQRFKIGADASTTVGIKSLGLAAADVRTVEVQRTNSTDLDAPTVGRVDFEVPPGISYVAVAIFDEDVPLKTDLDLFLYRGDEQLGKSVGPSSTESLEAPTGLEPGTYTAYIFPYTLPPDTESVKASLHIWLLPAGDGGTAAGWMQVSPTSVRVTANDMGCCPITLSFSGLDFAGTPPKRYIGALDYSRADGKQPSVPRTFVYLL